MPTPGEIFVIAGRRFECLASWGRAGEGSYGEVFPARSVDGGIPGDIVVKVVNLAERARYDAATATPLYHAVFLREIDGLKGIRDKHGDPHRVNVVHLRHHGEVSAPAAYAGTLALVMERCLGSLRDVRANPERPEFAQAARTLRSLPGFLALMRAGLTALAAIHDLPGDGTNGAHRDVKPGNFLLTAAGSWVLADFGGFKTALETDGTRSVFGNAQCSAPEVQAVYERRSHKRINSGKADIYSLGRVLQIVLGGGGMPTVSQAWIVAQLRTLSAAEDPAATIVLAGASVRLPPLTDLAALLLDMLTRRPEARPGAADLLRRLDALTAVRREPPPPRPAAPASPPKDAGIKPQQSPRRRPWRLGLAGAAGLCLTALPLTLPPATPTLLPWPAVTGNAVLARWSGKTTDIPTALCGPADHPALPAGQRLLLRVRLPQPLWPLQAEPAAAVLVQGSPPILIAGTERSLYCRTEADTDGPVWSCALPTPNKPGPAVVAVWTRVWPWQSEQADREALAGSVAGSDAAVAVLDGRGGGAVVRRVDLVTAGRGCRG